MFYTYKKYNKASYGNFILIPVSTYIKTIKYLILWNIGAAFFYL